ncbi:ABC transporter permease [Kineosporia sp. R_H_3]|uniref:ABC transporter permease n=1 Tax=Kineosporia sp. R_H_3 TaxID=1961848 RepID=UPI000B4BEC71|nr:ABC transporter permease [Kineosporia sp. R_H_3]
MLRITLKSVRGHFVRFLLTAFAVMVGTGFVAGTFVLSDSIRATLDGLFNQASKGVDVVVRGTETGAAGQASSGRAALSLDLEKQLAAVPGVKRVVPDLQGTALIAGKDGTAVRSGGAPGLGFFWDPQGQSFTLLDGRGPTKAGEVAVEKRTLELSGLAVGDTTQAVIGEHRQSVTIVGEVKFGAGTTFGATAVLVDAQTARTLFAPDGRVGDFQLEAADGTSEATLRAAVAKVLPADAEAITVTDFNEENQEALGTALGFITTFLLAFAGIALFVGAFIIYNTFAMIVAQRTRELALLRAVGASRPQVRRVVLGEAFVVGLVGSAVGIGFGVLVAAGAKAALRSFVGIDLSSDLPVDALTVATSLVVGTVVTMVGAYIPARRAARIAPVAAMRDDLSIPAKGLRLRGTLGLSGLAVGAGLVVTGVTRDDIAWLLVGPGALLVVLGAIVAAPVIARPVIRVVAAPFAATLGVVGRLARENALRVPRRTATTASALMIGLALISALGVVAQSTKASVADLVAQEIRSDFVLSAGGGVAVPTSVGPAVAALPGVQSVADAVGFGVRSSDGEDLGASAGTAKGLGDNFDITMRSGSLDAIDRGEIIVNGDTAAEQGWTTGSKVSLAVGALGQKEYTVGGVYAPMQILATDIVVGEDLFEAAVPAAQRFNQGVFVKAAPGADLTALRAALVAEVKQFLVVSVEDGEEFQSTAAAGVNIILGILYALLLFSVVIAVLGIINTLALSVFERTREIGLLRAVGLRRRQLSGMITIEAVTTALFGALLGTALGVGLGVALQRGLKNQGLELLAIPWSTILVVLAASAFVGVMAAVLPTVRAVRLDILKAIATE